jgi:hypothetical protein
MEPTQCSETSAFNTQTPKKYPEDNLSLLQHGESLKTRIIYLYGEDTAAHIRLITPVEDGTDTEFRNVGF